MAIVSCCAGESLRHNTQGWHELPHPLDVIPLMDIGFWVAMTACSWEVCPIASIVHACTMLLLTPVYRYQALDKSDHGHNLSAKALLLSPECLVQSSPQAAALVKQN